MAKFTVTSEELKAECLRVRYSELLAKPEVFPSKSNWDYIIEHAMEGIGEGLYRKYLVSETLQPEQRSEFNLLAISEFPRYLKAVSRTYALKVVYGDTCSAPEATAAIISKADLFDAPSLLALIDSDPDFVISCLGAFQPEYDGDDVDNMNALLNKLDTLPRPGKSTLLGRMLHKEYTLSEAQVDAIDELRNRIEALERLLG